MSRLRSFYDGDRAGNPLLPTHFQTAQNRNEVYCSLCGAAFFVDDMLYETLIRVIGETLENPFICEDCLDEYEELAHRH